jgi:hypothetical protein
MRQLRGSNLGLRASALWGKPSKGETRSSALWGKGGRSIAALLAMAVVLAAPATGTAGPSKVSAFVSADLLAAAKAHPSRKFNVIVQGREGETSKKVARVVKGKGKIKRAFRSVTGVSARLSGGAILGLARNPRILAITADAPVSSTSYENGEMWRESTHVDQLWSGIDSLTGLAAPSSQAPSTASF